MDSLEARPGFRYGWLGVLLIEAHLPWALCPSHLAGVQPILQLVASAHTWQHQAEEHMFPQQAQQGTAQAQAEEYEEPGDVVDAHLEGLQGDTSISVSPSACLAG